jgi:hypothetical protein
VGWFVRPQSIPPRALHRPHARRFIIPLLPPPQAECRGPQGSPLPRDEAGCKETAPIHPANAARPRLNQASLPTTLARLNQATASTLLSQLAFGSDAVQGILFAVRQAARQSVRTQAGCKEKDMNPMPHILDVADDLKVFPAPWHPQRVPLHLLMYCWWRCRDAWTGGSFLGIVIFKEPGERTCSTCLYLCRGTLLQFFCFLIDEAKQDMIAAHTLAYMTNTWALCLHPGIDDRLECRHTVPTQGTIKALELVHLLILSV